MPIVYVIIFALMLIAGIPIAHVIGIESLIYMVKNDIALNAIPQKFFAGIDNFVMLAIPGFLLAGNIMNHGGITQRIVNFSKHLFGTMRGGLGVANVVASMIFAGISGSAVGDTAAIGGILIPGMIKDGYDPEFSVGVTVSSSALASLIPPSITMIIMAGVSGLSAGQLLIAGALPGVTLGLSLIVIAIYKAYKYKYPRGNKSSLGDIVRAFFDAFWALLMTIVILVGILSGYFSPTEASIVAVLYALFVSTVIYRELKIQDLPKIIVKSMTTAAALLTLTGFASVFAWILTRERIPQLIAGTIMSISSNKIIILLMINILLIIVGMFMEKISAILILFPIILGITGELGMNPIHVAMIVQLNLSIGLFTPPVGVCLFLGADIANISFSRAARGTWPFIAASLVALLLVTFIPQISLFLPELFY